MELMESSVHMVVVFFLLSVRSEGCVFFFYKASVSSTSKHRCLYENLF